MKLLIIICFIVFVGYTIYRTVYLYQNYMRVKTMKAKENELEEEGVTPYGGSLSHGLSLDESGRYVHESKESLLWYKRLLN